MQRKSQRIIVLDSRAVLAFPQKEAPAAFDVRDMILAAQYATIEPSRGQQP